MVQMVVQATPRSIEGSIIDMYMERTAIDNEITQNHFSFPKKNWNHVSGWVDETNKHAHSRDRNMHLEQARRSYGQAHIDKKIHEGWAETEELGSKHMSEDLQGRRSYLKPLSFISSSRSPSLSSLGNVKQPYEKPHLSLSPRGNEKSNTKYLAFLEFNGMKEVPRSTRDMVGYLKHRKGWVGMIMNGQSVKTIRLECLVPYLQSRGLNGKNLELVKQSHADLFQNNAIRTSPSDFTTHSEAIKAQSKRQGTFDDLESFDALY
jgi:hypothetical protein